MDKEDVVYYSAIKKNEILSFATRWMVLEGIMLNEISQTERQMPYDFTYNLKNKWINKTKQKQIHRYREQADGCQRHGGWKIGIKNKIK